MAENNCKKGGYLSTSMDSLRCAGTAGAPACKYADKQDSCPDFDVIKKAEEKVVVPKPAVIASIVEEPKSKPKPDSEVRGKVNGM